MSPKQPSSPERTLLVEDGPTVLDSGAESDSDAGVSWEAVDASLIGQRIKDTYLVKEVAARGELSTVYKGVQLPIERPVAIKILRPDLAADATYHERFFREIRVLGKLTHPNIVTFIDGGETQLQQATQLFLVTEFLVGQTLRQAAAGQGLPFKAVNAIVQQVCAAAGEAHRHKLIHRDLNPDNVILLDTRGVVPTVKVLDFGLAKPTQEGDGRRLTNTQVRIGTAGFVAPEQVAHPERVDERADVYSIGALLYFLVHGESPYGAGSPEHVWELQRKGPPEQLAVPDTHPAGLDKVLARALAPDPNERFQSAHALAEAVARCEPVAVDPTGGWGDEPTATQIPTMTSFGASGEPTLMAEDPLDFPAAPREVLAATEPARRLPAEIRGGTNINLTLGLLTLGIALTAAVLALLFLLPSPKKQPTFAKVVEITPQAYEDASGVAGITDTTIVLGAPLANEGPVAAAFRAGLAARLQEVNAAGGVHRRQVRLFAPEGQGAAATMEQQIEKKRVFAFVGSTQAEAVLQAAQRWPRVLFFAPLSGLGVLRSEPPRSNVFHLRPSVQEEVGALMIHLVNTLEVSPRRIAIVHGESLEAKSALTACLDTLREYNVEVERVLQVPASSPPDLPANVKPAARAVLASRAQVDAVIALVGHAEGAALVEALREHRFRVPVAFLSSVGSRQLAEALGGRGKRLLKEVLVSEVMPPFDGDLPGVVRYQEAMARYQPQQPLDALSLEGYLAATVFLAALERVEGGLTSETVRRSLESLTSLDLGLDTSIDYSASDHDGLQKIWITALSEVESFRALQ